MTVYILSSDDSVPVRAATAAIHDYLGDGPDAVLVRLEDARWADAVAKELGIEQLHLPPGHTTDDPALPGHLDTVIGPADEELVKYWTSNGATYLDAGEGLLPLVYSDAEVPSTPDLENLPEPVAAPQKAVAEEAPAPQKAPPRPARKKKETAVEKPKPAPAEHTASDTIRTSVAAAVTTVSAIPRDIAERTKLMDLLRLLLEDQDTDTLWGILFNLRGTEK